MESLVARLGLECRRLQRENHAFARVIAEREQEIALLRAGQREYDEMQKDVARFLSARDHILARVEELLTWIDMTELPLTAQTAER